MGEIANTLINGEACSWCGVHLEPNETIYTADGCVISKLNDTMPANGEGFGIPVICEDCATDVD